MNFNLNVIQALVRKDLLGLLPLIGISLLIFLIVPAIASMDLSAIGGDQEFWALLPENIYWLGYFVGLFLVISALQLDPADSLDHDWLTRPIVRRDWMLAKLVLLTLVFLLPVFISRVITGVSIGMGPGVAIYFAAGIERFDATVLASVLVMMGLLAPNLRKLIILMISVFFVFLLPGWSVTRPLLAAIGIPLGGDYDSLMWVQGMLIVIASIIGFSLIFWFQYCRRQRRAAYAVFWTTIAIIFLSVYTPESLYNWDRAVALNASLINTDNVELEDQVFLDQAMACFPAAIVDAENHSEQESNMLVQARWSQAALSDAGPGAISFATPIRYQERLIDWISPTTEERERGIKWRFNRIHSEAWLSSAGLDETVELRRSFAAENRYAPISATKTDHWLLEGETLNKLGPDQQVSLTIAYDGVLLSPTPYELAVDGVRRRFPELGYCKAELDSGANEINVECLKRGVQPDLVSAEFIGMESSRVDSNFRANLTNNFVESLKRQRYELTLPHASIADNPSVIVTAYNAERMLNKQLTMPGLLGDKPSICPLPNSDASNIERPSSWSDKSPHEISFVSVERGVRLEVLDWRQEIKPDAKTLFLLPGLGATAHSYDDVAIRLAQKYNVVGMTRRGTGDSSKPDRGYEIERLAQDVLQVMDALELPSAILLGHSFGGEELSYLGANHPDRVEGLIYADAAYDRVSLNDGESLKRFRELDIQLPEIPPVRPSEAISYESLKAYAQRLGRSRNIPEGELIASYDLSTGQVKHDRLYLDALMRGIVAPDYRSISVPALALYAVPGSPDALLEAWYNQDDPGLHLILDELFQMERARKLEQIERFESELKGSKAVILEDADHWIFLSNEEEVLQAIDEFIDEL